MNLNDMTISALAQLDRGHDEQTLEAFRRRLTDYANEGQADLARAIGFTRTDTLPAENGLVELGELPRNCLKVKRVEQRGKPVLFKREDTGAIGVPYTDPASITYVCEPKRMTAPSDECELPAYTHGLIVNYMVGRERMAGDVSTQRGANIYLSMYEAAKAGLRPHYGDGESYRIVNRW